MPGSPGVWLPLRVRMPANTHREAGQKSQGGLITAAVLLCSHTLSSRP